jgi:hypothetical protein
MYVHWLQSLAKERNKYANKKLQETAPGIILP